MRTHRWPCGPYSLNVVGILMTSFCQNVSLSLGNDALKVEWRMKKKKSKTRQQLPFFKRWFLGVSDLFSMRTNNGPKTTEWVWNAFDHFLTYQAGHPELTDSEDFWLVSLSSNYVWGQIWYQKQKNKFEMPTALLFYLLIFHIFHSRLFSF